MLTDIQETDKLNFTSYKPQNNDGIDGVIDFELSSTVANEDDSQPSEENAATRFTCSHVDSEAVVSAEEEEHKGSSTIENTIVSATDTVLDLLSNDTSDQILSMTKLVDIENFMDTLLDSKLEESCLDDPSQNVVPHEAELSTAKPLTDVQLMGELYKIKEKLSSTPEHSDNHKKDNNEEVEKRVDTIPLDSCIGNFIL